MTNHAETLRTAAAAVAGLGSSAGAFASLPDDALLSAQRQVTELRRAADAFAAWIAGEIARRSTHELGESGLAQRGGHLSPEALIQSISGSTRAEASTFVAMGTMMAEAESANSHDPAAPEFATTAAWQQPLATAVLDGALPLSAADAIRRGLGVPDDAVTASELRAAAEAMVGRASGRTAELLLREARRAREQLDVQKVAAREKQQRDLRYVKAWRRSDGMIGGSFLLDPEDGGLLLGALDSMTSPRRGGPRFVDPDARKTAEDLINDPRTNEQINADTLIGLVRIAVDTNPNVMLSGQSPAVRILVTTQALASRDAETGERNGLGRIEGTVDAVSMATIERHLCESGTIPIEFDDDGRCMNVGRESRLFTKRQRIGLAARDGGCRFPECDRPPSWTEAHHIQYWQRDGGRTDVDFGILLCRRHHLLIHNQGWRINYEDGQYFLIPPASIDAAQAPLLMPSKSPENEALRSA